MGGKQNPELRRRELCDAAITLLAREGIKGVTHLKVDRKAAVPDGTTSFYFRTSSALIRAAANRIADLDLADLTAATRSEKGGDGPSSAAGLARLVIRSGTGARLVRSKARYELVMPSSRDAGLAEAFSHNQDRFFELHRNVVLGLCPADTDPALIDEKAYVLLTFISGLLLALARGDRTITSDEQLHDIITALVTAAPATSHREGIAAVDR
ncbi:MULTISPECIES: TetR/AcrR family transcriptional regulator [unclassified Mycolicibacterium]|uniref:TetR/AcrR family transcriptional regulator n=1 Tax=unclassified Mycolicibacterium TaxID=2636767 RepID=UPI0012DBDA24|nr:MULTISPECIES: TetR/AcrR family transcriptional regulator [unclassified Mycolicibacterium]MUL83004.1 TetR/AcrR family transcriptional regulator [Mycolicibacterium sp. CBMA 329]MUL89339.1 TetR/AcrR family transcriptional regulator [Mycolicibacterium sp. CBMA 331]MUL99028.1 TetR/AcrR family transcriptional regulator [Mycolicibacterium sp. CBMA 334]MUM25674.1 TetR/AcrR family transcriptional regulator [Mycolicibacterium sp. CBMA 295]MUM38855.1 TetR/AcrR family transcriptional regulator [Mycolic